MKKSKFILTIVSAFLLYTFSYGNQNNYHHSKAETLLNIGEGILQSQLVPVRFQGTMSYTQTIYTAIEMNGNSGQISKISYNYNNTYGSEFTRPMRVYMAITDLNNFDWVNNKRLPDELFTLIYSSDVTFTTGEGTWEITLDTPLTYTSGNLCIKVERYNPDNIDQVDLGSNKMFFYATDTGSTMYSTLSYYLNSGNQWYMPQSHKPNIKIYFKTSETGITGTVKGENQEALSGAKVSLTTSIFTTTDDNGKYKFTSIPADTYTLKSEYNGYHEYTEDNIIITEGEMTTKDINMVKLESYTVSSTITDEQNNPIENAKIYLEKENLYQTTTNTDGKFIINNVLKSDNYKLIILKEGFNAKISTENVNSDLTIPNIKLSEMLNPPINVKAILTKQQPEEEAEITWDIPTNKQTFRYDNGIAEEDAITLSSNSKSVFGSCYSQPTVLDNMSWYTVSKTGGPHTAVNIFVFDVKINTLTGNKEPIAKILYSKENVPNTDDTWNTFTFPKPVECPNGFFVAISSIDNNPVGLAHDLSDDTGERIEWPYIPYSQFLSFDYTNNTFNSMTSQGVGFRFSFLIRAEGYDLKTNKTPNNQKTISGYNIYRFIETLEPSPALWDKLNTTPLTENKFHDSNLKNANNGMYKYAVKTIYTSGESISTISKSIPKGMLSKITINIETGIEGENAAGATINLTNKDGNSTHIYNLTVPESGTPLIIDNIWKGEYSVTILLEGYRAFNDYFTLTENEKTLTFSLIKYHKVNITTPENGTITAKAGNTILVDGAAVLHGTVLNIIVQPEEGYLTQYIRINDEAITEQNYTVNSDITIEAEFAKIENRTITILPTTGGTLTIKNGTQTINNNETVPDGTELTIIAKPSVDYILDKITVNNEAISGDKYTVMFSDLTISANFTTVGIEETEIPNIIIYPNPANNYFTIEGEFSKIELYNTNGKCLGTFITKQIDINKFPEGIYFIKIFNNQSYTFKKLVIKK